MFALTLDLLLAAAAWATVAVLWIRRRAILPQTVWEKLQAGTTLAALALTIHLADRIWSAVPWPALATPAVQEAVVAIGLLGGVLAMTAGVIEWIPVIVADNVTSRWRARWSSSLMVLERSLAHVDDADRVVGTLVSEMRDLCATPHVHYCAFRQKTRDFVLWGRPLQKVPPAWQAALNRAEASRMPGVYRQQEGWLAAIPVLADSRLYGTVLIRRPEAHTSLDEIHLLFATAQRCALTLARIVRQAQAERQARASASAAELERLLGRHAEPVDDLMEMFGVIGRELAVEFVSCLALEGEGGYARRYSQSRDGQGLSERGLEVSLGGAVPSWFSTDIGAARAPRTAIPSTAIPFPGLAHQLALPLVRGGRTIGLLAIGSRETTLGHLALDLVSRFVPSITAAIERIEAHNRTRTAERRQLALSKAAMYPVDVNEGFDRLTQEMLAEIPGTFCQYMRLSPDQKSLRVHYRRSRRNGWGHETAGLTFGLERLPTCRMVAENGRSVLFRQDDPERLYDPEEAERLFGAVPHSVLMVPVMQEGACVAILAVGEMREPARHAFETEDRRFADSFVRLATRPPLARLSQQRTGSLDLLGDLTYTFASPLTGIIGSVEILRQKLGDAQPQSRYLDVIERNAARIREVVSELADLQHGPRRTQILA
jgi:GAF domain-containing protein